MKRTFLLFLFCCLFSASSGQSAEAMIIARHKALIMKNYTPMPVDKIIANYDSATGTWRNIDYQNRSRSAWDALNHLGNIHALAYEWAHPRSAWYHNARLTHIINGGIQNWHKNHYWSDNWWHNEIGVPQVMRNILVMAKEGLGKNEMKQALDILNQHQVKGTGANLIWSADLGLFYGLLTLDKNKIRDCAAIMQSEIKITEKEGLQPDFSFQQHEERLQMYHYGGAYLKDNIRIAWELRETEWAYPPEKIKILVNMLTGGWQWMARGINTVPGTIDRAASRKNMLKVADIRDHIQMFIDLAPEQKANFEAIAKRQDGEGNALEGFRYFPYSDFTAYQQKDFSFFLKTISSRTLPTESINSENLKGQLLSSGDHYFIRHGNEYFNMMPVWNWSYLPGTSSFEGANKVERKKYNGSVSDGFCGISAMDYKMIDSATNRSLGAKKIWANYENVTLCLMGAITLEGIAEGYTTMNQCRLLSDVMADNKKIKSGPHDLKKTRLIYHDQLAYMPLNRSEKVVLVTGPATGSWGSINRSYSMSDMATENVFMPYLLHTKATPDNSGYAVAYVKNLKQAKKMGRKGNWQVLSNTAQCQAVMFQPGVVMAAFYEAGSINTSSGQIKVNQPCMLLIRDRRLFASDPTHSAATVELVFNGKKLEMQLPRDGSSREFSIP